MKRILACISILIVSSGTFALEADTTAVNNTSSENMQLAAAPPGLQKKGMSTTPSFLGKTPPGWSQGLKRGWNKDKKNWRWDKRNKMWENKNWHWDSDKNAWERRGWGRSRRD